MERGITEAINDDRTALDAFGVFVLLHRHQRSLCQAYDSALAFLS